MMRRVAWIMVSLAACSGPQVGKKDSGTPEPDAGVAELHSLEPVDHALAAIFTDREEAGSTDERGRMGNRAG